MVPYSVFTDMFLSKVTDYDFLDLTEEVQLSTMIDFLHRAVAAFRPMCQYDLSTTGDDDLQQFDVEIDLGDLYEVADIISEGMLVSWMKPYVLRQEHLQNFINTRDFSSYSPANLLAQVNAAYTTVQRRFINMMREYSYRHGDLTELHML